MKHSIWVDHASIGEWNKAHEERGRSEITGGFFKQWWLNIDFIWFLILQTYNTISPLPVAAKSEDMW